MAREDIERRLAAILSADVVGYSRLMGEDDAGTFAAVKALRKELFAPKVVEHHGRIVKLMGDGALVEFPSVVDAVECAVAVQRGVAERNSGVPEDKCIALRIGVNLGDIIIEGNDIYGDGVNVAARVQELAAPGGIALSATAHEHAMAKSIMYSRIWGRIGLRTFASRCEHTFTECIARTLHRPRTRGHSSTCRAKPRFRSLVDVCAERSATKSANRRWKRCIVIAGCARDFPVRRCLQARHSQSVLCGSHRASRSTTDRRRLANADFVRIVDRV